MLRFDSLAELLKSDKTDKLKAAACQNGTGTVSPRY
jgi:hypothetical protein